jgi:hypothetical protein
MIAKWICLSPYPMGWGNIQEREIGAIANGLRQNGEIVDFLVLDSRSELTTTDFKCIKYSDLNQSIWWELQGRGVLVTLFGTKTMRQIYDSASQSGWKVWARMDCDGVPGPSGGLKKYFSSKITEYVDVQRRKHDCSVRGTSLGIFLGLARGLAGCAMAKVVNRRLLASFNNINLIMVETDYAFRSFTEYFEKMGRNDLVGRLRLLPPAISETFQLNPGIEKNKTIIAIGQWWRYQKNMEFLCRVIAASRVKFPAVSWQVVGLGSDLVESRLRNTRVSLGKHQVQCHPHLTPEELNRINQDALLIFYSSRHEGFPNTLCEALCCGASFVAPNGIQAFDFCESQGWGTSYNPNDLSSAINAIGLELKRWEQNKNFAFSISEKATSLFHRKQVAKKLVDFHRDLHLNN